MEKKENIFNIVGPQKSFIAGFVAAFLVLFSLGFFVLLFSGGNIHLNKGGSKGIVSNEDQKSSDNEPSKAIEAAGLDINIKAVTTDDHVRGDLNKAQAVVVEFSDLECPFCKRFHNTMKQVVDVYDERVAWVYRHFPLDQLHSKARKEAEATECAAELGGNKGFWAYIDKLFEVTPSNNRLKLEQLPEIAKQIGLDTKEFQNCLDSGRYADKVQSQYQDAVDSGGRGTPYSVVLTRDGQKIPISGALSLEKVKTILDPLAK